MESYLVKGDLWRPPVCLLACLLACLSGLFDSQKKLNIVLNKKKKDYSLMV